MITEAWWSQNQYRPMAIRLIVLAWLLATIPIDALARDHGQKRDPGTVIALVIHTVGGPACIANTVQYRPIPRRDASASPGCHRH